MVLWCLPLRSKCEWSEIRGFVAHYNSTNGTSYARKSCLDVEIRDRKAPELLLESPSEPLLVIERKSVVWPRWYMSSHSNEHQLFQLIPQAIAPALGVGAYELTVRGDYLKGRSKSEVRDIADQIIRTVLSDNSNVKLRRGIAGSAAVPWSLRHIAPDELDFSESPNGIRVVIEEPMRFDEPFTMQQELREAKNGYAGEFRRAAENASAKFEEYQTCERVLLVQFHGDNSVILDEDIVHIIKSAQLPGTIDQVWLAEQEWVSEDEYTLGWIRVG